MKAAQWKTRADGVDRAIMRATNWIEQRVTDRGFRGVEDSLLAHYKAPYCLAKLGRATASVRVMRHVMNRFHDNGTFHRDVAPGPSPYITGQYTNAWLAAGAFELGLHDVAERSLRVIEESITRSNGAAPTTLTAVGDAVTYDAGTASRCIESLLNAGRVEHAMRLGLFLKSLYDGQAAAAPFVTWVCDHAGNPYSPTQKRHRNILTMLEVGAPNQCYWFLGFSVRCLARLYRIDGWHGWTDTAERILGWLDRSHSDKTANITNGKLGWGMGEMFSVTGDERWAAYALKTIDWLVNTQTPGGVWIRPESGSEDGQDEAVSLDVATERAYYLQEMMRALALAATP